MLDNIREWISDRLRYILLILAAVLVVIIVVLAIRLATRTGKNDSGSGTGQIESVSDADVSEDKTDNDELSSEADSSDEGEKEQETDDGNITVSGNSSAADEILVQNEADILETATAYWTAINELDFDTLEELCAKTFDEEERESVASLDVAVESYDNIITYSKSGLTEGSYVVYVYMEMKLTGIESEAPTLRQLYMETDEDGRLTVIQADDFSEQILEYTRERQTDADVQALIKDVSDLLDKRCEEDEDLNQYIESRTDDAGQDSDEEEEADGTAETVSGQLGTMKIGASTGVNIRSEASTDGAILGSLIAGSQVEVLENLDNGWSRISYVDSSGSTVEGYMMTQYLTSAG